MNALRSAAFYFLAVVNAGAADFTGSHLLRMCTAPNESTNDAMCIAYLGGFRDGITLGQLVQRHGTITCIPEVIDATQAKLIFEKYARDNPNELHKRASLMLLSALGQAFPCQK
jgi:Rap1a immunity proteins